MLVVVCVVLWSCVLFEGVVVVILVVMVCLFAFAFNCACVRLHHK